jgi:3D-(3,5/4)-trihydroxycyclohexane-1,2-dione acylhydrolase (decyclizing)
VVETIAGRANMVATHPLNTGPIGVTGSDSANAIAEEGGRDPRRGHAVAGFHHRIMDGLRKDARIIGLNVGRHDAAKHLSLPVVGDAKLGLEALGTALAGYTAPADWTAKAKASARRNGTPMSPTTWPTGTGPIPTRRPSAW